MTEPKGYVHIIWADTGENRLSTWKVWDGMTSEPTPTLNDFFFLRVLIMERLHLEN